MDSVKQQLFFLDTGRFVFLVELQICKTLNVNNKNHRVQCMYFTDKRTDVWSQPTCIYTKIFSPKKTGFSLKKSSFQNFFNFCLPLFYATFQCGP